MKWLKSFADGRGGFDTMEWDMGDVGMEYVFNILKYVIGGFLLCVFISPLLLFCHLHTFGKARKIQTYISFLCGGLFMLDAWYGGIFWGMLVQDGVPGSTYIWVVTLTYTCLIIHAILNILDEFMEEYIEDIDSNVSIVLNVIMWFLILFMFVPAWTDMVAADISHVSLF